MNHVSLRQFIRLAENNISFSYDDEWHAEILDAAGLEPRRELGSGYFGTVYEAEYVTGPNVGRRVAVKVTDRVNEPENYQRIMQMAKRMPPNVRKHFPHIYDIHRMPGTGYAIAMELLAPLPRDIAEDIFDPGVDLDRSDTTSRTFSQVYGDPTNVSKALRKAIEMFNDRALGEGWPQFQPQTVQALEKWSLTAPVNGKLPYTLGIRAFNALKSKLPEDDLEYAQETMEIIFEDSFDVSLPQGRGEASKRKAWIQNPSVTSLARALGFVYGNGVDWNDMKRDNLGIRPSTGDIVVLDLGLFDSRKDMSGRNVA